MLVVVAELHVPVAVHVLDLLQEVVPEDAVELPAEELREVELQKRVLVHGLLYQRRILLLQDPSERVRLNVAREQVDHRDLISVKDELSVILGEIEHHVVSFQLYLDLCHLALLNVCVDAVKLLGVA